MGRSGTASLQPAGDQLLQHKTSCFAPPAHGWTSICHDSVGIGLVLLSAAVGLAFANSAHWGCRGANVTHASSLEHGKGHKAMPLQPDDATSVEPFSVLKALSEA